MLQKIPEPRPASGLMLQKIPELRPGRDGEQAWGFGVGGGVPKGGARTRLTFDPGRSKGEGGGRAWDALRPVGR